MSHLFICADKILLVFISFLLSFLVLQIVKNTNELINRYYDNLEKNFDLFQNGHLRSDKV
jgi:cell division protein FtsX